MYLYIILGLLSIIFLIKREQIIKKIIKTYNFIYLLYVLFIKSKKCNYIDKGNYIIFSDNNNKNIVFLPKNNKYIGKKFFLIKDNKEIEIKQLSYIPYFITAKELGGEKILVKNIIGNIIKEFSCDEIPRI